MQTEIPHSMTYDFDGRATVGEVATLVAQERLFREAMAVLEACFPGFSVEQIRVDVREVRKQARCAKIWLGS